MLLLYNLCNDVFVGDRIRLLYGSQSERSEAGEKPSR